MELSAIWVVVIVLIGIAIGVYSICKGCQGLREQSAQAIANLQERTGTTNGQNTSSNDSNLYRISGSSVHDKNPPNYDEIMEPPPSYEETIKLHGAACYPIPSNEEDSETCAQVNYACTGCEDELHHRVTSSTPDDSTSSSAAVSMPADQSTSHTQIADETPVASCSVKIDS